MEILKTIWWLTLIRGIVLLFMGLLAVAWPGITLIVLSYLFVAYVITAGIVNTIFGIMSVGKRRGWFLNVILGIAEIVISIYVLQSPAITLAVFIGVVGITFMAQGVLQIIIAFADKDMGSRLLDTIGGILALVAGFFILRYPISGGLAFTWVFGAYGIFGGSLLIAIALGARVFLEDAVKMGGKKYAAAR